MTRTQYCAKKISEYLEHWNSVNKIPSVSKLSNKFNYSPYIVRLALYLLSSKGRIIDLGYGYYKTPDIAYAKFVSNKQNFLINMAANLVSGARLLFENAIKCGPYLVKVKKSKVFVYEILNGKTIETEIKVLQQIIENPIDASSLLSLRGSRLTQEKIRFKKQTELFPLAHYMKRKNILHEQD